MGLPVVWAVTQFKLYVMGMPFVVAMDQLTLKATRIKAKHAGQLQRFAKKLSTYDYDIVYQLGKETFAPTFSHKPFILSQLTWSV